MHATIRGTLTNLDLLNANTRDIEPITNAFKGLPVKLTLEIKTKNKHEGSS